MKRALKQNSPLKNLVRSLLLISSISVFAISVAQIGQHWNYTETLSDVAQQIKQKITPTELAYQIQTAINDAEFEEAKTYIEIAKEHQLTIDVDYYERQIKQKDRPFKRIVKNTSDFAKGFAKGKSSNLAGVAGAVSADFTVVGDVRDLRKEYLNHQAGKPVNELIVVLSGTGIGLTALTVGSLGASAPVKAGASTFKLAVKSQRLSARFQKHLLKLGRKVFDWPAFTRIAKQDKSINNLRRAAKSAYKPEAIKPLQALATRVNSIRKSSSTADTLYLLKYVENTDDLRHLEKVTLKHGAKTKGLFKLLGKGVIRTTRVLKRTTELFLSIISSVVSGLLSIFLFVGRRIV